MEIKYIILVLLLIAVIYLIYKKITCSSNSSKIEKFEISDDLKTAILDQYNIDIDAMRNLGGITNNILENNDTLTIPAENLIFNGNVKFNQFYNKTIDIMPFASIMILGNTYSYRTHSPIFPLGWAPCDGNYHKPNYEMTSSKDKAYLTSLYPEEGFIRTPLLNNLTDISGNVNTAGDETLIDLTYIMKII
jgi:hypothetical protein